MAKKGTSNKNRGPKYGGRAVIKAPSPPKTAPLGIGSQIHAAKLANMLKGE